LNRGNSARLYATGVLHCADILAAVGTVAPFMFCGACSVDSPRFSITQRSPPQQTGRTQRSYSERRVPCQYDSSWLVDAWIGLASELVRFWALLDDVVSVTQLDDVLHAVHLVSTHHGEQRWVGP
jgi:hypothetical protein